MISYIIVSYRSQQFLADCLQSIHTCTTTEYEVIIVENHSGENIDRFVDTNVSVHYNTQNKGFGDGVNFGARFAKGEWLMIINPDTQIQGDISPLITQAGDAVGIIGLCLTNANLIQAYQFGYLPTPATILFQKNKTHWESIPKTEQYVEWVSGGAMLIRKNLFQQLQGFDDQFFMYFEDIDLCRRAREKGYTIRWTNAVTVNHYEGGSQPNKIRMKSRYFHGQYVYINKWYGYIWATLVRLASWLVLLKMHVYNRSKI